MNDNNSSYTTDEDDFWNYNHPYDIMTGNDYLQDMRNLNQTPPCGFIMINSSIGDWWERIKYGRSSLV